MEGLSAFEQAVLDKLLAGEHQELATLRKQAEQARLASREYTGVGFFCDFDVPPDAPALPGLPNIPFGDVSATIKGLEHGAGFILFIEKGRLATLEGYSYEESWPSEIESYELMYQQEPRQLYFGKSQLGL